MVSRRRVLKYASKFFIPLKKTDLLNLNSGFAKLPQQSSRNPYCLWLTYEHPPHSLAHGGRMNMFSWLKSSHKLFQSKIGTEIKMFTSFPGKKTFSIVLNAWHGFDFLFSPVSCFNFKFEYIKPFLFCSLMFKAD